MRFSPFSLFKKIKNRLMRSSYYLCVPPPLAYESLNKSIRNGVLHKSRPSVCVSISPGCCQETARKKRYRSNERTRNSRRILDASFSILSVSYQRKVGEQSFPEPLVLCTDFNNVISNSDFMSLNQRSTSDQQAGKYSQRSGHDLICLESLRDSAKQFIQGIHCPFRNSTRTLYWSVCLSKLTCFCALLFASLGDKYRE